jgi:uncharacterized protein YjiS (DUF1127 family)
MTENPWHELNRRIKAMHTLWQQALSDLSLNQVNHHERDGVLPIAFSLMHYVNGEDRNVAERLLGEPQLWEADDWAARVGGNVPKVPRGSPMSLAEQVRFGDLAAWRAYQSAVFARTERTLATAAPERFGQVLYDRVPDSLQGGFIALLAGDGPVRLGDLIDAHLYQHGIRHLGEIEHARSLVGLGGVS